jgi:ABC-type branched-subunit amino acid transport system substrate-binding protein
MFSSLQRRLLLLSVAGLSACGPIREPHTPILLGAVLDRTGNNAEPSWAKSIELARTHVNDALSQDPTLRTQEFVFQLGDSANDPNVALRRARDLKDQGVKGLIVDSSQNDIALNKLAYDMDTSNDLEVPLICTECTSEAINDPAATDMAARNAQKWNYRAVMSHRSTAQVMVRLLLQLGTNSNGDVNQDRKFKVGVYVANEPFGQSFAAELRAAAEAQAPLRPQSPTVSIEASFHPRDAEPNSYEWRADLDRLSDASPDGIPDAIVVATFAQYHSAFVRSFKGSYNVKVLHAHNFRIESAVQSLGQLGDDEEGISQAVDGPAAEAFAAELTEATGVDPGFLDANYYDAATMLMLAALVAGGDDPANVSGPALRDALATLNDPTGEVVHAGREGVARAVAALREGKKINYEGASGPMDFDVNGNVKNVLQRYRAEDGDFTTVESFDCVTDPLCPSR